ncbi:MAG: S8 family serine peptidase [Bryobacterales bacterium]|nr:S8 family serine peptidase [Bryobacterales bacterium]
MANSSESAGSTRRGLFATIFLLALFVISNLYGGTVPRRYIVELESGPLVEQMAEQMPGLRARVADRMRSSAAEAKRSAIRQEHGRLRQQIEQRQARVLDTVENVANAMFVEVAADTDVAQLRAMPGVKRVVPVRTFHLLMDRAVILHKVVDAWNQVGQEKAGAGVKIAIIDTGVDAGHPALQDSSLAMPGAFPRTNQETDLAFTSSKVIVARSYVSLLPARDPDRSARDRVGHGTALATVAAGMPATGPLATITGVAPKAYIGSYKVFGTPGFNDNASDDAIIKAIDDAVADGMDVINLSLGSDLAPRFNEDLDVQAVERATKAGVVVVAAAGNAGPDYTSIASPSTAPSAIAVGATTNDRTFSAAVELVGWTSFRGMVGGSTEPSVTVTGPVANVSDLDTTGLACSALPGGSLQGRIAVILRGSCTFETKLLNAQRAGAVGAVVHAAADAPSPISMAVGSAAIPAQMVSYDDGMAIKARVSAQSDLVAVLRFALSSVAMVPNRLAQFSGAGPNVDNGIKPDIMAVGSSIYVGAQSYDPNGDMYDASGFVLVNGTSFSSPVVAGAVALIKAARPGLTADQYRSLVINSAGAVASANDTPVAIQKSGAGLLDVSAALRTSIAAAPVSIGFGAGGTSLDTSRTLTITNISDKAESYSIAASPRAGTAAPVASASFLELQPGASADIALTWSASGLAPGTYEGFVTIVSNVSGSQANVPYWYAAAGGQAAKIRVLSSPTTIGRRNGVVSDAIFFRIIDPSGLAIVTPEPVVTTVSGGGSIRAVNNYDSEVPGLFSVDVQLGPVAGANVFRIESGSISLEFSVAGR